MKNLFRALWAFSKQKLLESESAAKSMRELLSEKDIQIIELKKELSDLKSCSHEKFPVAEDTPVELNDSVSLGQAALSSASQSNQTDLGSSDVALDDLHLSSELVAEVVSEEFTCYGPERSPAYPDMQDLYVHNKHVPHQYHQIVVLVLSPFLITGRSVNCDTSATSSIGLSSRHLKTEESCTPDAFEPKCDVKKGDTEIMGQVVTANLIVLRVALSKHLHMKVV